MPPKLFKSQKVVKAPSVARSATMRTSTSPMKVGPRPQASTAHRAYSGKGTRARLNTYAQRMFNGQRSV